MLSKKHSQYKYNLHIFLVLYLVFVNHCSISCDRHACKEAGKEAGSDSEDGGLAVKGHIQKKSMEYFGGGGGECSELLLEWVIFSIYFEYVP